MNLFQRFVFLFFILIVNKSGAQNLISNGDFENFTACPSGPGNYSVVSSWLNAGTGTPDYFNSCGQAGLVGVPGTWAGYQNAYSGNGFMGIAATNPGQGTNIREFISTKFTTPLQANKCYHFSMRINLLNASNFAVSNIGVYFSAGFVNPFLNITIPQIENIDGNFLADTLGWMLFEGYYHSNGGEKYLTIGNFRTDNSTVKTVVGTNGGPFAFYGIDDVSLMEDTVLTNVTLIHANDTILCKGDSIIISSSYMSNDALYSWSTGSTSPSITIKNTGSYILKVIDHCSEAQDTINVSFLDLPIAEIGSDAILCNDSSKLLQAPTAATTHYSWQDGSQNNYYLAYTAGNYVLTATNICGTDKDSVNIKQVDCDCNLFFPDAITLNGDNLNEEFYPHFDCPLNYYSLKIFNRWGTNIFSSSDPSQHWNGKISGNNCQEDVYPFICDFTTYGKINKRITGMITLIY